MYVMHNSEYPLSCFALFENGPCLVADANFDTLMVKLKGFFQNAKANKIESRGTRYQYCDFLVKLGTVTMGPSARGISVESSGNVFQVESHPSHHLQGSGNVFQVESHPSHHLQGSGNVFHVESHLSHYLQGSGNVFQVEFHLSHHLQSSGNVFQVEYCPCVIPSDCWNLLMEFMQNFMGSHTPGIPSVFGSKHDSTYSPGDTMVQYMELFNKIRKQQQVPVAGIR
ncbi:mediator complex subunit 20 [Turdus rufiventris]|nr:mediator complex subunit 20 [Turdus rufiventris]